MTKIKQTIIAVFMAFTLTFSMSGCAALMTGIPQAVNLVQDAVMVLQVVQAAFDNVASSVGVAADTRQQFDKDLAAAFEAVRTASSLLQGVEHATQNQIDSAFTDFRAAYANLMTFLAQIGVVSDNQAMTADGHSIHVHDPLVVVMWRTEHHQ